MTYIEQVARLLEPALWDSFDRTPPHMHLRLTEDALEMSRQRAAQIIEKMESASPEMIAAGEEVIDDGWATSAHIFQAMMSAARRGG